jgi:hypothetical protein
MKDREKEVKPEIKHHVPLRKKVKAIQDYSMNISPKRIVNVKLSSIESKGPKSVC